MRERISWVDTARFLGIFSIYLGHFGTQAGKSYNFVFQYHVAFFFLLSGCMNTYDSEANIIRFTIKKIKSILVPFWSFSVLSIVIYVIQYNEGLDTISDLLLLVAKGSIRNSFFAASLWFFTCLFFMEIIFKILKFLKKRWIIFIICLAMYVAALLVITPPGVEPHWLYNLDSVFYYIIFFAVGYIMYPYVIELFKLDTGLKKTIFIITGEICFVYAVLLFNGRDGLSPVVALFPILQLFVAIMRALLIIWLNLVIAKIIEKVDLFNEIGRNTLFLCGNEYIIRILLPSMTGLIGWEINVSSPLAAYLYTAILLLVCLRILIPNEKRLLSAIMTGLKKEDSCQNG